MNNNYNNLLDKTIQCDCGRKHHAPIKKIIISKGVLEDITEILAELSFTNNFHLVYDANTYKIAGITVEELLMKKSIEFTKTLFTETDLIAYDTNVDKVIKNTDHNTTLLITIGSGTLNDITRYAAYKTGKPYIIIATAPSMDGYASSVSPLVINGFKNTFEAIAPIAILGDTNILKKAPKNMITAGFGDIIGKYISLADWKLSKILQGEYYCDYVESIVRNALEICIQNLEGLKKADDLAIENLMHALILSGIAMLMVGNSRPASGAEHHLSHFWEMYFIKLGGHQPLHGEKVGIAAIIMSGFYNKLANYSKEEISEKIFNVKKLSKNDEIFLIKSIYKEISESVINENFSNDPLIINTDNVLNNWEKIVEIAKSVPDSNTIRSILERLGAVTQTGELDIDDKLKKDGIIYCMYIRKKITILRLMNSLGLLKETEDNV